MAHDKPSRQLVSVSTAAEYLNVNPRTIRRMIADGELNGYRIGGSLTLIRVDMAQIEGELLRPITPATGGAA